MLDALAYVNTPLQTTVKGVRLMAKQCIDLCTITIVIHAMSALASGVYRCMHGQAGFRCWRSGKDVYANY